MDMEQLTELLSSLAGTQTENKPAQTENIPPDLGPLLETAMQAAPAILSALSASGTDLSGLMQSLTGGGGIPIQPTVNPVVSPQAQSTVPVVQANGRANQKTQLLRALKPYLSPRRASKVDRAISMLDTAYTARTALKLFTVGTAWGGKGEKGDV